MRRPELGVGDWVLIVGGDYTLTGKVASEFQKFTTDLTQTNPKEVRYVIQVHNTGLLLIQNRNRLRLLDKNLVPILEPGDAGYKTPELDNPDVIISRMYAGARIVFSRDGEEAWLTDGDREHINYGVLMGLRKDGTIVRKTKVDEESIQEWDELSPMGRNYAEVTLKCKPKDGW